MIMIYQFLTNVTFTTILDKKDNYLIIATPSYLYWHVIPYPKSLQNPVSLDITS